MATYLHTLPSDVTNLLKEYLRPIDVLELRTYPFVHEESSRIISSHNKLWKQVGDCL